MTPSARLVIIAGIIMVSALYAVLVAQDPHLASAIASGYVAMILTVMVVVNTWKKP